MTDILMLGALYGAYGVFWARFLLHAVQWARGTAALPAAGRRGGPLVLAGAAGELLLFLRLFRSNGLLWIGEWVFHASLALVLLRHLRYVLEPVPAWIQALQPWGLAAGYLLPFALAFILVIRLATTLELYSSRVNLLLLASLLVISSSGVLMHAYWKPDLVGVKAFMTGMTGFAPEPWPGGVLATLHVAAAALMVPWLPTHIFAAPVTLLEARARDAGLRGVLHGE